MVTKQALHMSYFVYPYNVIDIFKRFVAHVMLANAGFIAITFNFPLLEEITQSDRFLLPLFEGDHNE